MTLNEPWRLDVQRTGAGTHTIESLGGIEVFESPEPTKLTLDDLDEEETNRFLEWLERSFDIRVNNRSTLDGKVALITAKHPESALPLPSV
jgi:hypothetical protein